MRFQRGFYRWLARTGFGKPLASALKLFDKRLDTLIFVATTGRSATKSLTDILRTVPEMAAFHEPEPILNRRPMIERNFGNYTKAKKFYGRAKSASIRMRALGHKYYAETSHIFIKSYSEFVIEDFPGKVKIVHLFREPIKVAASLYRLGVWPGTEKGNAWYLDPNGTENIIQLFNDLSDGGEYQHPFFKCLWYWYEIEARLAQFRKRYPDLCVVEFPTNSLGDVDALYKLMENLDLEYDHEKIAATVGVKRNLKDRKSKAGEMSIGSAESMHTEFKELLVARGYGAVVSATERLQFDSLK